MKSREVCTKHEWNPWTRDPYQPKIPCLPKIPVIPRSQSIQDPSHPKIPVIPRSQSTQDPSQPKIPANPRSQSTLDALMPIWHLAHAYLIFGSCLFGIWLMQLYLAHVKNLHQLNFSSIYYIPTWISVMGIWQKCIFPSLKKCMRQGPAIFSFSNFFQFHYCLCSRYILALMNKYCTLRSIWEQTLFLSAFSLSDRLLWASIQ